MAFRSGDRVKRVSTLEEGVVREVMPGGFCEVGFPTGNTICPESDLEATSTETAGFEPRKRLEAGQLAASELYMLHLQSAFLKHAFKYDARAGLSAARVEPKLHQIYVTLQVLRKLHPRMILADEVGLGKTIEAGLIIKELRARGLADRVLVVCPASLLDQWQQELESKFNEPFVVFNREALVFHGKKKGNPWDREDSVICSLPFATRHSEGVLESQWDLVVFDEAHKLNRRRFGSKWETTKAWELGDELKDSAEGILLLTATPMQLDLSQLYSLLQIVEPGLFKSLAEYERRSKELPAVNALLQCIEEWDSLSADEQQEFLSALEETKRFELAERVLSDRDALSDRLRREQLINDLSRMHPLATVMVRNRKSEIGGFKKRIPFTHPITLSDTERELYEEVTEYIRVGYDQAKVNKNLAVSFLMVAYQKMLSSSSASLTASFKRRIEKLKRRVEPAKQLTDTDIEEWADAPEASTVVEELEASVIDAEAIEFEIATLEDFVSRLDEISDSKASVFLDAVSDILDEHPDEKILVFTQFIDTQLHLARELESRGYAVSIFSGRLNREAKEASVKFFRDHGQVMVSTEAGGEGRNFQFCHIMFNYDLPWNPMRVEQRIGRLDRIGQTRDVEIHNLSTEGTVEERVLNVLQQRIQLFEESVGSLDPILGAIEKEIETCVMHAGCADEGFDELEGEIEARAQKARAREIAEQDLAMDRNSLRRDIANDWLNRRPMADGNDLEHYVRGALDYFGGRLTPDQDGSRLLTLPVKLGVALNVKKPRYVGDFDPRRALAREELEFFAFGHEVIDGLIDMPSKEPGASAGCRRLQDQGPELAVEVFYEIAGTGSGRVGRLLRRGRFIRHEVHSDGTVHSEHLESLPKAGEPVREVKLPEWIGSAMDASWRHFVEQEYAIENEALQLEIDRHRQDEHDRARRIHEHRRTRIEHDIRVQEEWLAANRDSASERIQRVLPAREGRLVKLKEKVERLDAEHELQVQDIDRAGTGLNMSLVAAGLVVRS